ncbi:MAG TPA: hypothetical protein PKD70_01245 [Saprospiraceae bacterium]|nr:hypothetical protein [Saprospiraceae bacterium]HMP12472.1 hypothetical protein [Saprospiraceae bacterium]
MKIARWIEAAFRFFFNDRVKSVFEQVVLILAASGFLLHLGLILLNDFSIIQLYALPGGLLGSPISAIYTPFSFILIYEVYLLVYYLPASFTTSIAKQFEIISLIKIRAIFKDISKLKLDENWFRHRSDIVFMVDIIGFLILFYLIFWFYKLKRDRPKPEPPRDIHEFILWKKLICSVLIIILAALSIYSFVHWVGQVQAASIAAIGEVTSINNIFYDEFFSILILVDVFLLIVSFKYTERYSQLIRNSGFIISTILIRLSFNSADFVDMGLIITGVLFGVLILRIYNSLAAVEAE